MNTPVVLITGALSGIGRATALAFAKKGARVVVAGRRDEAGQNLVAPQTRRGGGIRECRCAPRGAKYVGVEGGRVALRGLLRHRTRLAFGSSGCLPPHPRAKRRDRYSNFSS
jgi:NAD(P)-dependent dehydrogenase (short-subunit alcohol dehydrogenase family)